jgi:hypothetical protein
MNPLCFPSPSSLRPLIVAAVVMFAGGFTGNGQTPFKAGDILTTNLTMQNRFLWTNDNGQVFPATNSSIRLSDFAGKIAFFVFFDVW